MVACRVGAAERLAQEHLAIRATELARHEVVDDGIRHGVKAVDELSGEKHDVEQAELSLVANGPLVERVEDLKDLYGNLTEKERHSHCAQDDGLATFAN